MFQLKRFAGPLLLLGAMALPFAATGCYERVRVYDEYHSDYHHWNGGEVRAYNVWVGERHYDRVDYNKLERDRQKEYWNWRHDHPGRY